MESVAFSRRPWGWGKTVLDTIVVVEKKHQDRRSGWYGSTSTSFSNIRTYSKCLNPKLINGALINMMAANVIVN